MKKLICFGLLMMAAKGWGAITVSSQTATTGGASPTVTLNVNCQGGNLLVLDYLSSNSGPNLYSSATYAGAALTIATGTINSGGPDQVTIAYLVNPAAGTNALNVTASAGGTGNIIGAICFSGANTSTPIDVANCSTAGGGGGTVSVNLTPTVNNDFLVDDIFNNNTNAITQDASQTLQISQAADGAGQGGSTKGPVSASLQTMKWTASSFAQPAICAVAIEPAPVANTTFAPTGCVTYQ